MAGANTTPNALTLAAVCSCRNKRERAIALIALAIIAAPLAIGVGYISFLINGPMEVGVWYNKFLIIYAYMVLICIGLFFVYRYQAAINPDRLFFFLVLTITVCTSVIFDIQLVSWDVTSHFEFILRLRAMFNESPISNAEHLMLYPNEFNDLLNAHKIYDTFLNSDLVIDTSGIAAGKTILNSHGNSDHIINAVSFWNLYRYVATIPGALVYAFCSMLHTSFTTAYVAARIPYAVIYAYVCYRGIRYLDSGKMIYATVAMIPTSLFIAANYNYDYWITSFTLLGFAMLAGAIQKKHYLVTPNFVIKLMLVFMVGLMPKVNYAPLILLCLIMPKNKFQNAFQSRLYRVIVVITSVITLGLFAIPFFMQGPGVGDIRGGDVNPAGQIVYIFSNFSYYIFDILIPFMLDFINPIGAWVFLGNFAYLKFPPLFLSYISLFMIVFVGLLDKSPLDIRATNWKIRIFTALICAFVLGFSATYLYIDFTPVGSHTINGFSPRYIIPVLFPLIYFLGIPKVGGLIRPKIKYFNMFCMSVLTVIPLIEIYILYVTRIV